MIPFSFMGPANYKFQNASAETYFNALVSAGFTEAQCISVYDVPLNSFRVAVDNLFAGLVADGLFSKLIKWTPAMGGSLATNVINAVAPGTNDSTYSGTPVATPYGTAHDGASWENFILTPNGSMDQNDFSIGCVANDDYIPGVTIHLFGAQVSGSSSILKFRLDLASGEVQAIPGTNGTNILVSHGGSNQGLWVMNRSSVTATRLDKNGATYGSGSLTSSTLTSNELIFGGLNNNGTKNGSYLGAIRHAFIGTFFSTTDSANFKNRIKAFDSSLGINIL